MARAIVVVCCTLAMLASLMGTPASQAQTNAGLQLIAEEVISNSRDVKFPHVAAGNGLAFVTGVANRSNVHVWTKADNAGAFPAPTQLGTAGGGDPDYLNTTVTVAPDGSVYMAWTTLEQGRIFLRRRDIDGNWGPIRTVANSSFPIFAEVAVASDGRLFLIWSEPGRTPLYRISSDQGVNWSSTRNLGDAIAYSSQMDLSTGANGRVAAAWTGVTGNQLQVFLGQWNGDGFTVRRISTLDSSYADASVTFGADGRIYYAWRDTEGGVYFTEQQPDGSFPRSRLTGSNAFGLVNVNADEGGNIHVNWIAEPGGEKQLFYAFKEAAGAFRGPVASSNGGAIFNSHAAASASSAIYAHSVAEEFTGGGLRTRYSLWRAEGTIFGGNPLLENGAATVGGKSSVDVNFTNLRGGTPNEVRWRWNAAPTDEANDSGGYKPFANPLSVPIPQAILNDTSCQPVTLYTQLRDTTTGNVEKDAKSDAILIDTVVEADAESANPYLYVQNAPASIGLDAVSGALGGDPNHTRIPLIYIDVTSFDDCTDLKSVGIGRSATAIETVVAIDDNGYSGFVPIPGLATLEEGEVPVTLQVRDGAGNVRNFSSSIIFDETPPTLDVAGSGTVAVQANPAGDLFQNITLNNLKVSDSGYGGRGFWGLWVAVSRTAISDPAESDALNWSMLKSPGTGSTVTLRNVSLATGLPANQVTAGTYYVYVRALDGAGNPSDEAIEIMIESTATAPGTYLPLIQR